MCMAWRMVTPSALATQSALATLLTRPLEPPQQQLELGKLALLTKESSVPPLSVALPTEEIVAA